MSPRAQFIEKQRFNRNLAFLLRVPAVLLAAFGAFIIISGIRDDLSLAGTIGVIAVGVVTGVLIPWLLWSMHLRVSVDADSYDVALWPLPLRRSVQLSAITEVTTRTVDPIGEYGGWGVKGKKDDLFFSVGGIEAVSVTYEDADEAKRLTVTTPQADELRDRLRAVVG